MGRDLDAWASRARAVGAVVAGDRARRRPWSVYGHWGRPVLVFPSEQGRAGDFANNGMVDAVGDAARRRPGEAVLRRLATTRRAWSAARPAAGGAGPAARRVRVVDRRPGRAVHRRRLRRRPGEIAAAGLLDGRLPRAELRAASAPTCSRWRCASPATTTRRRGAAGASAATATYFNNPVDYVGQPARRPPGLAARRGCRCCWSAGRASGRTPPARCESTRRMAGLLADEGHPARAGPVGLRRAARLAVVARAVGPPPAAVLLSWRRSSHDRRTNHIIGLLLGTEEDWPRAFEALMRPARPGHRRRRAHPPARRPSGSPSSRSTCATSRGTRWSSTGWPTGTTTRASG